jgi:hypothetical protein
VCAVHGWGPCPNPVAPVVRSSSQDHEGKEEGEEDKEELRKISVVPGLLQRSLTRQTVRKTIKPEGQPQGPLAPRTTLPSPSLIAPPTLAPPPSEDDPLGFGTPLDLKSPCGQPHHPTAGPFHLSNRQGSCARVLGLDGQTESLRGRWRKESGTEEEEGERFSSAPKEVTRGGASGGARGGALDLATAEPAKSPKREEVVATQVCG